MPISSRRRLASLHSLEHLAVLEMGYDDNDALALADLLNLRVRQDPRATEEIVHVSKFQFSFGDNNVFHCVVGEVAFKLVECLEGLLSSGVTPLWRFGTS